LGDDRSSFSNYGGQLLSASIYDKGNVNNLERLIPNHVLDNEDNDQYKLFVNMIGQHFDNVWTHIKHITEINDTHHTRGISRDLVYFTLKSLGVEAFDQFENSNLIEYILGQGTSGSAFYDVPVSQSLVTASNAGSLPKKDLSKEVWKRLYHNAPYLLKTKGTERGIKALISCYGIPSTILNVKEYGGPVKDKTGYKTFSYEKSGLALNGETTSFNKYFLKTNWNSLFTQYLLGRTNLEPILDQPANTFNIVDNLEEGVYERGSQKTITFRIKPKRTENTYHLFGFSASNAGSPLPYINTKNQAHFVLTPYTGNDISSSGDSTQYGKIDLFQNQILRASTPNFPVYNGDFWNVFIGVDEDYDMCSEYYSGSFGAYQANFNKNISSYFGYFNLTFGSPYTLNGNYHFDIGSTFGGQVITAPAIPATTASTEVFTVDINADLSSANFQDYDLIITDFHGQSLTLRHNPTLPVATGPNQIPQTIITPDLANPGNGVIESNWLFFEGITQDLIDQSFNTVSSFTYDRATSILIAIDAMLGVATQQNGFLDANGESNILVPAGNTNFNPSIDLSITLSENPSSPYGIAPYNQGTVDTNNVFPPQAFQSSSFFDSGLFESTVAGASNNFNIEFGPLFVSDVLLDSAPATLTGFTGGTNGAPGQNNVPGVGAEKVFFGGSQVGKNYFGYSGSLQEVKYYYGELLTHDTLKKQALEPFMYAGNTISSSFNHLVLRLPLGSNDQQFSSSFHPNSEIDFLGTVESDMDIQKWEEVIETHHHPTPDTVGISMTSEKVRIDEGTIDDNLLSTTIKSEVSTLDRQPQDFEDLGVFFSPTTEINEDIVYQLGSFRLDDYIGSPLPSAQTASVYEDLKALRKEYFKRVKNRYNYWDYVKLIQYIDHTLFKLVEQFVPAKANLKTGLLIEPHYLERTKFARELPIIEDGQTMTPGSYNTIDFQIDPEKQFTLEGTAGGGNVITTNNLLKTTGSNGQRQEQGTNFTINVSGHILDEQQNIAQAPIRPFLGSGDGFAADNVIKNGDFSNGTDNWLFSSTINTSGTFNGIQKWTLSTTSGNNKALFRSSTSDNATLRAANDDGTVKAVFQVGKIYRIKFDAAGVGAIKIETAAGAVHQDINGNNMTAGNGSFEFTFIAGRPELIFARFDNNSNLTIDNVYVQAKINDINATTGKPPGYVERKSSVLLGNVTKAKQSNRYYRSVKEIKSHKNVEPFNTNLFPNPFDPLSTA